MGTRLEVTFNEVIINEHKQLVGGSIELHRDSSVKELLAETDEDNSGRKPETGTGAAAPVGEPVVLAGTIAEVIVNEDRQQVSVLLTGQTEPTVVSYAEGPVTLEDEVGNRYRVDEQGQVTNEGAVADSNSDTGAGTSTNDDLALRLFTAILDDFAERMDAPG